METPSYASFAREALDVHIKEFSERIPLYLEKNFGIGANEYHPLVGKVVEVFKEYLLRPAKRLRGSFVLRGYQLAAGKIDDWVYDAAIAVEILHAYILVMDDFQDLSPLRRGQPTVHELFRQYYEENFVGDAAHYGISIASLSGMLGMHEGVNAILRLNIPEERKNQTATFINTTFIKTVYGQIHDVHNQSVEETTEHDVMEVHRLKTAYYTYYSPIALGFLLAGAPESYTQKIEGYATPAGVAFQVQDDILGVFGNPDKTGKSNMTDIMEGKATLLTVKALEKATPMEKDVLYSALGDRQLEHKPAVFKKVQEIITKTGSLEYSKQVSHSLVMQAKESLQKEFGTLSENEGYKFIAGIADYMIERDL